MSKELVKKAQKDRFFLDVPRFANWLEQGEDVALSELRKDKKIFLFGSVVMAFCSLVFAFFLANMFVALLPMALWFSPAMLVLLPFTVGCGIYYYKSLGYIEKYTQLVERQKTNHSRFLDYSGFVEKYWIEQTLVEDYLELKMFKSVPREDIVAKSWVENKNAFDRGSRPTCGTQLVQNLYFKHYETEEVIQTALEWCERVEEENFKNQERVRKQLDLELEAFEEAKSMHQTVRKLIEA